MARPSLRWCSLLALTLLAGCAAEDDPSTARQEATTCPEAVRINSRGEPVGVVSGKVRYCWPGEAACLCDAWGDCYALTGYVACTPPASTDAGADAADVRDASDVLDAADVRDVTDAADVRDASDVLDAADVRDVLDAADVRDASDVLDAADVRDASDVLDAADVRDASDVSDAADVRDASDVSDAADVRDATATCPEAVRINARGEPVGVVSGKVRYCWPTEASCYCDAWGDCYAQTGYVACTPPPSIDAGVDATVDSGLDATVDSGLDATMDSALDAAADRADASDAALTYCPEAVRLNTRGEPIGIVSGKVRYCWPGEASCYCDAWGDCYAQGGYVACTPPPPPDAGAPSDAPPLPIDPVTYTGTLSTLTGQRTNTLTVAGLSRTVYSYVPTNRSARPPLVIAYHGTDLEGSWMLGALGAQNFAETYGVVVLAPNARFQDASRADFNRPLGNATYWVTAYDTNPDTNPDILLTRALIKEAQRALNVDTDRVYTVGFSNGGFMALFASVLLRDRVAGFAESNAGLVTCATRESCGFQGTALTCAGLATQSGWCSCSGPERPVALPATGGRPGFLWHAVNDPTVSSYYTCTLDARMGTLGIPRKLELYTGSHSLLDTFIMRAWPWLSSYIR